MCSKLECSLSLLQSTKDSLARDDDTRARYSFSSYHRKESDFDTDESNFAQIQSWKELFKPYLIHFFELGGSGADIGPLKTPYNVLSGLKPDSQRYFDHHHSENDTFESIHKRELELGAATMTALVYLIDKYGIINKVKL